jgi:hypothetical protein
MKTVVVATEANVRNGWKADTVNGYSFWVKVVIALLGVVVAFLLVRMLVKGATAAGVTRSGQPMAYWSIVVAQSALVVFFIYVLVDERI